MNIIHHILFITYVSLVQAQHITIFSTGQIVPGQQAFFYHPYDIVSSAATENYMQENLIQRGSLTSTLQSRIISNNDILLDDNNPRPQTVRFCRYVGPKLNDSTLFIAILARNICGEYKRSSPLLMDLSVAGYRAAIFQSLSPNISSNIIVARTDNIEFNTQPFPLSVILLGDADFSLIVNNSQILFSTITNISTANVGKHFAIPMCQVQTLCVVSPILFGLVMIYGLCLLYVLLLAKNRITVAQKRAYCYWVSSTICLTVACIWRLTANLAECNSRAWGGYVLLHLSTGLIILAYTITAVSWVHTVFPHMSNTQAMIAIIIGGFIILVLAVLQCVGFIIRADIVLAIIMASLACLLSVAMTVISGRNYIFFLQKVRSNMRGGSLGRRILWPLIMSSIITIIVILLTGLSFSSALDLCSGAILSTILYVVISVWPLMFTTWIYKVYIVQGGVVTSNISTGSSGRISNSADSTDSRTASSRASNRRANRIAASNKRADRSKKEESVQNIEMDGNRQLPT